MKPLTVGRAQLPPQDPDRELEGPICQIVGGVISPLLLNIALHDMEDALGVVHDRRGQITSKRALV